MKIIEIKVLENGAHRNLTTNSEIEIPSGWAIVPDYTELPNFPFGEVEAEEVDGVMTVTKWVAGVIPEVREPEQPVSETEQLRADIEFLALMTGVEL